jgi:GT2 family glycosyltransferase
MLFSVVIPAYNRSEFLPMTLATVSGQRFSDFEVIVVNDGSSDKIEAVVGKCDLPVRLLSQAHLGPGPARNVGASHARGAYLAFLDSDDCWFPWTLECFAALIEQHDSPALLSGSLRQFSDDAELSALEEEPLQASAFADYLSSDDPAPFVGACMTVIRRDVFRESGGFVQRRINCEDHDLVMRVSTARGFVQITAPTTIAWRQHAVSETRNVQSTIEGNRFLVAQELAGHYPGGPQRAPVRRAIIARHARAAALAGLSLGHRRLAWQLYRETFTWHVQLRRWKFLFGFVLKALVS